MAPSLRLFFFGGGVGGRTGCTGLTQIHCRPHTARTIDCLASKNAFWGAGGVKFGHPDAYICTYPVRAKETEREQVPTLHWEQSASKQQRQNGEKASKCNRREDAAEVEAGRAAWGRGH